LNIGGHPVWLFESGEPKRRPVVYMPADSAGEAEEIWRLTRTDDYALACIGGVDWNLDMSPWPASTVFKDGEDFGGGADAFLALLTGKIVPEVEMKLRCEPERRGIVGYSLSGLFALYALYKTELFNLAGSISGSLWFDGWIRFMDGNAIKAASPKIYLSLGDKEKRAGNARMAAVESCTLKAEELLKMQGAEVLFELNLGNHFVNAPERIARGIRRLLQ
jgi:predicted alpha/beta superfamily hydrolase